MAKSAKHGSNRNSEERRTARHGGSTFLGILIGLVLGLMIALAVAWYINKLPNPWKDKPPAAKSEPTTTRVPMKAEPKADPKAAAKDAPATTSADMFPPPKPDAPPPAKVEEADKSTPVAREAFYLQAGSFQNASEADSLKARLALLGLEATVQARNLPEKGVWHRVRVGPYTDVDEINRIRDVLRQNNVDAALVKVREAEK